MARGVEVYLVRVRVRVRLGLGLGGIRVGVARGVEIPPVLLERGGRYVRRRVGCACSVPSHCVDQRVRTVAGACVGSKVA